MDISRGGRVFNCHDGEASDGGFGAARCESVDTSIWVMTNIILHGKKSIHSKFATFDDGGRTCCEYL